MRNIYKSKNLKKILHFSLEKEGSKSILHVNLYINIL